MPFSGWEAGTRPQAVVDALQEAPEQQKSYEGSLVTVSPARAVPDCTILA